MRGGHEGQHGDGVHVVTMGDLAMKFLCNCPVSGSEWFASICVSLCDSRILMWNSSLGLPGQRGLSEMVRVSLRGHPIITSEVQLLSSGG